MKLANIEAIIFIFILFFLIIWGLPKCKSEKAPPAPVAETPTPPPLPQADAATANTVTPPAPATTTSTAVVTPEPAPAPAPAPQPAARLSPKPMSVKTNRPAARPVAPAPSVEQTVPFNPEGGNSGEVSSGNIKNVWTVTSDVKLRGTPGLDGKLLGKIPKGVQLTYLNVKTDKNQKLIIDGIEQDEPWLKVRTPRGTEGWVYGGVVRFYKKN